MNPLKLKNQKLRIFQKKYYNLFKVVKLQKINNNQTVIKKKSQILQVLYPRNLFNFRIVLFGLLTALILLSPTFVFAENDFKLPVVTYQETPEGGEYSVSIQILAIMTMMSFIPAALMMLTGFTRIIVVFAILRQAIGLQQTPSNQILLGLALFLTIFVMTPVFNEIKETAILPYTNEEITSLEALNKAQIPIKEFMLMQIREDDLALFIRLADDEGEYETEMDVPLTILAPAFVTSELKTAFQIGFLIFIPFLIIDLVIASLLMAMGMMMLSPVIVSLPFKIMMFVLIDGWALVIGSLASSFGT
ncbi:MAG: flagellar type III secretion system pore protein FliP [Saccharospirillaceae bacterium]|nr:flagellar type III secretion system pore protein FliP [Saccharospirillaceae bacterium]